MIPHIFAGILWRPVICFSDGQNERIDRAALAKQEVAGAELGDARRTDRLGRITLALATNPGESLPKVMVDEAALEATYRFLGNESVLPSAILAPHVARTRERCAAVDRVLVLFDTTELRFGGYREGLGYLSHAKGRGLIAHVGLAVNADGRREPLGTLHAETIARRGTKKHRKEAKGAPDSESLRWHRGVLAAHEAVPEAICVMDREADIFELVSEMQRRGQHFIIRAAQSRSTDEGPLWDQLEGAALVTTREIMLAERSPRARAAARKAHPPRSAHAATLEIHARRVTLRSPAAAKNAATERRATSLELGLVHVVERNPPEGDAPVEWVLLTNLPIKKKVDVEFIVDAYGARWVIEEFFKALKTGCAFEKRQLESVRSVTNALAVSLPIACPTACGSGVSSVQTIAA